MTDTSAYVSLTSLMTLSITRWSLLFSGGEEAGGVGAEPPQGSVGGVVSATALAVIGIPGVDGVTFPDGTVQTTAAAEPTVTFVTTKMRRAVTAGLNPPSEDGFERAFCPTGSTIINSWTYSEFVESVSGRKSWNNVTETLCQLD